MARPSAYNHGDLARAARCRPDDAPVDSEHMTRVSRREAGQGLIRKIARIIKNTGHGRGLCLMPIPVLSLRVPH